MTPNHIEVLIHCYVSPNPHPRWTTPSVAAALRDLEDDGLVVYFEDGVWTTTTKGEAHIKQILNLPLPTEAWLGAGGEIIKK